MEYHALPTLADEVNYARLASSLRREEERRIPYHHRRVGRSLSPTPRTLPEERRGNFVIADAAFLISHATFLTSPIIKKSINAVVTLCASTFVRARNKIYDL